MLRSGLAVGFIIHAFSHQELIPGFNPKGDTSVEGLGYTNQTSNPLLFPPGKLILFLLILGHPTSKHASFSFALAPRPLPLAVFLSPDKLKKGMVLVSLYLYERFLNSVYKILFPKTKALAQLQLKMSDSPWL